MVYNKHMETKKTYKVDLRNLDTENYRANPCVVYNWNWASPEAIVGRTIFIGSDEVEIEYMDGVPNYLHHIGIAHTINPTNLKKELVGLAMIPGKKPSNVV